MKTYIGIDPGLKGGIGIISDKFLPLVYPMPVCSDGVNVLAVNHIISKLDGDKFVVMEKAHAMPRQGVTSMFNFGKGYGALTSIVEMLYLPYTLIAPHTWQKEMLAGTSGETKARAATIARRLFPDMDFKATPRCKKDHDGMVDALLIAEYGRRKGL